MKNWIIELPDDFETMTEHEQDMNIEIAYIKRKEAIEVGFISDTISRCPTGEFYAGSKLTKMYSVVVLP